jgi:hypothetical protein
MSTDDNIKVIKYYTKGDPEYIRPVDGTRQDNMTYDQIKRELKGYTRLKTMEEKRILTVLPILRTNIKYINHTIGKFRTGCGLIECNYPDNILVMGYGYKKKWFVYLDNCTIYIKEELIKEVDIKNHLYTLYKSGKLKPHPDFDLDELPECKIRNPKSSKQETKDVLFDLYLLDKLVKIKK